MLTRMCPVSSDAKPVSAQTSGDQETHSVRRVLRRLYPVIPFLAILYAFLRGTFAQGPRDIDTRYFFIAGKAWVHGESPYDFSCYQTLWHQYFSENVTSGVFAYLPGSILYAAPLGMLDWPEARALFHWMNLAALLGIVLLCLRYTRSMAPASRSLPRYLWLAFGVAIGGVPGTIFTGQSTLMVCLAALAVVMLHGRYLLLLVPAILVASSKPQLTAPALIITALGEPLVCRRIWLAGAIAVGISVLAILPDAMPFTHLSGSVLNNASLGANTSANMIGLGPLLNAVGLSGVYGRVLQLLAFLFALVLVVWSMLKIRPVGSLPMPAAGMACFTIMGLAYPFHEYDTAFLIPMCAMLGLMSFRRQMVLLPLLLVLSRPGLIELASRVLGRTEMFRNRVFGLCWLLATVTILWWTVVDSSGRSSRATAWAGQS